MTADNICWRRLTAWLLTAAAVVVTVPLLARDLWFDEALTLLHFALLPSVPAIWKAYVIPNNQLLHTVLLHFWMPVTDGWLPLNEGLRLMPLLTTLILILVLWRGFVRSCGWAALAVTVTAWILSPPFALFASSLRGYMLAALAVTAALLAARRWAVVGGWLAAAGFFAAAFAGVAAVPTTLPGIGAALLLAFADRRPWRNRRFWAAAGLALAAFGACYGGIATAFLAVCRLGEGWHNKWAACGAIGLAMLSALGPVLAVAGFFYLRRLRKRRLPGDIWRLCIWLAPVPACLLLPVAPFPRVFWCFFPVWVVLAARGLRPFFAWARRCHRQWQAAACLLIAVVAWGATMNDGAAWISDRLIGGDDDFFAPYYRRADFQPSALMAQIRQRYAAAGNDHPVLYASFAADPWALYLYGRMTGMEIRFDGPRGTAAGPFDGAVFRRDETLPEVWKNAGTWFQWKDWVVVK